MMYVQYPDLDRSEQLTGLQPLNLSDEVCCELNLSGPDAALSVQRYSVEALLGEAVLRLELARGERRTLNLRTGLWLEAWSDADLETVGRNYAEARSWAPPQATTVVVRDQWTVQSGFDPHRPMLMFTNPDGLQWYVSSRTAEVVQATAAGERFWNWLGSVIHWIYPTVLRQHPAIWTQTVIWLAIVSLFLTITGLVIGIRQFTSKTTGRGSPYRGWTLWHHYVGLFFGALTLTWLLSGFFSMNPWGAFESRGFGSETNMLNGVDAPLREVVATIANLPQLPEGALRLTSAYWLGQPHFLAWDDTGIAQRLSIQGIAQAITLADVQRAAATIRDDDPADLATLDRADGYYFSHHDTKEFPVYRIRYADGERYYLSALSGELMLALDSNRRWYRWLFEALHRGDFHAVVRTRPVWDVLMLFALIGVTIGAGTGTYLGFKRLTK